MLSGASLLHHPTVVVGHPDLLNFRIFIESLLMVRLRYGVLATPCSGWSTVAADTPVDSVAAVVDMATAGIAVDNPAAAAVDTVDIVALGGLVAACMGWAGRIAVRKSVG